MSSSANWQVVEAAQQYEAAYKTLMKGNQVLAALHCGFLALELYLKSLSAKEYLQEDPETLGEFIYAEPAKYIHELDKLFDCAPVDFQDALNRAFEQRMSQDRRFKDVKEALASFNRMFMGSRYPFDPKQNVNGIVISDLNNLLDVLVRVIKQ